MARPLAGLISGIYAGAAGATALSAATYADQVLRGRPGSTASSRTVGALADAAGIDVPGDRKERANRIEGAGPLAGYAVGVGVAAVAGTLRGLTVKIPKPVAAVVVGLAAMAISDAVATASGEAEPRRWTSASVATDALPHLAYGFTVVGALHRMLDPGTPDAA